MKYAYLLWAGIIVWIVASILVPRVPALRVLLF